MQKLIKDMSSFTNSFTYNIQLISLIYCIFSKEQPGYLFQNWPSARAAYSGARLIEGVAYSRKKQQERQKEKLKKLSNNNNNNNNKKNRDIFKVFELLVEGN